MSPSRRQIRIVTRASLLAFFFVFPPIVVLAFRASRLCGLPDIGHPFDVEEFYQRNVPPADNAWIDYDAAERMLTGEQPSQSLWEAVNWLEISADDRAWLEHNREALDRWRTGTQKDAALRTSPRNLSIENWGGSVKAAITWNELSLSEALRLESEGDLWAAWNWHRALFRYSRHRGTCDSAIERKVGASVHSLAAQRIVTWAEQPAVSVEQLESAIRLLQEDFRLTPPSGDVIRAEFLIEWDNAGLEIESYPLLQSAPSGGIQFPSRPTAVERFLLNEPEFTRRLLKHQVANLLEHVDRPRSEWPRRIDSEVLYFDVPPTESSHQLTPEEFQCRVDSSPLAQLCLLKVRERGFTLQEQVTQDLLLLALSAQHYRRLHGEFPVTIELALVDETLLETPVDLFDRNGEPLKYRRDVLDPQRAVVWSVSFNRTDENGQVEIGLGHDPFDHGYVLGPTSKN